MELLEYRIYLPRGIYLAKNGSETDGANGQARNKEHSVWTYFGLEKGRDGEPIDDGSVVRRTCYRRVLARHGNTSNLLSHLKANHSKL